MHFWRFGNTVVHPALSTATVPSTLCRSQTKNIRHSQEVLREQYLWTLSKGQQNFCPALNGTSVHLFGAVDKLPLKSFGIASQKLTRPQLTQPSMQCVPQPISEKALHICSCEGRPNSCAQYASDHTLWHPCIEQSSSTCSSEAMVRKITLYISFWAHAIPHTLKLPLGIRVRKIPRPRPQWCECEWTQIEFAVRSGFSMGHLLVQYWHVAVWWISSSGDHFPLISLTDPPLWFLEPYLK